MGPRAGLDRCGKSRPQRGSIPGPSSPQPVAIPTELPGPQVREKYLQSASVTVSYTMSYLTLNLLAPTTVGARINP